MLRSKRSGLPESEGSTGLRPQVPRVRKLLEQLELRRRCWTLQVGKRRGVEVIWEEGRVYHLVESWRVLRNSLEKSGEQRLRDSWGFPKVTQQAGDLPAVTP